MNLSDAVKWQLKWKSIRKLETLNYLLTCLLQMLDLEPQRPLQQQQEEEEQEEGLQTGFHSSSGCLCWLF